MAWFSNSDAQTAQAFSFGNASLGSQGGFAGSVISASANAYNPGFILRDDVYPTPQPAPDKPSTDMLERLTGEVKDGDSRAALGIEVEELLGYSTLRKDAKAPSRLARALHKLEIEVLSTESVEEYKHKMWSHYQDIADKKDRELFMLTNGTARRQRTMVSWHVLPLTGYDKPVPEFVLRKCVQIKKEIPTAKFLVEELREQQMTLDPFMIVEVDGEREYFDVWDEPEFEAGLLGA